MRTALLAALAALLAACNAEQSDKPLPTLLDAAEQGDLASMDNFLQGRQLVNMRDACLFTPLLKAALNGHYQAALRLVNKGAEVDLVDKGGYSALMLAASNNFAQVVELLIEHGADINRVDHTRGWSALIWAAKRGHTATVSVLLKHGADRSLIDDAGKSALDYATSKGYADISSMLQTETTNDT